MLNLRSLALTAALDHHGLRLFCCHSYYFPTTLLHGSPSLSAAEVRVAAATSLYYPLPDIAGLFENSHHHKLRITFGSSGNLVRQIRQGAPFEIFFSANEQYAQLLVNDALAAGEGFVYAVGQLALYTPLRSEVSLTSDLSELTEDSLAGRLKRLAMANPEHAPYGFAAKQALESAKAWDALKPKLVIGESAAQATQFALSGSVDAAIIPLSNVLLPQIVDRGRYALISEALYSPLQQRVVLLKSAGNAAREFYKFIQQDEAQSILKRYGFGMPDNQVR